MTTTGPTTAASLAAALWRQEKDERGACWECKAQAAPGRKRCERHLRMHRERMARRYAARRAAKQASSDPLKEGSKET